jgi:Contractile injection system tube protein
MSLTSSPKLIKGGLVVLAPGGGAVQSRIALQYNSDQLALSYQVQGVGGDSDRERAQPFRLKGPAIQSIKLDAEIDATDQLEFPDSNANAVAFGIAPQLATLEALVNPTVDELLTVAALSANGTLEILPPEAPLVLFIWGKSRVVPVRVTEFSITEEAFDPNLNPIRAKVSLGLRVMSTDDLGFTHRGGTIFISYLRTREGLAAKAGSAPLASLGITNLP